MRSAPASTTARVFLRALLGAIQVAVGANFVVALGHQQARGVRGRAEVAHHLFGDDADDLFEFVLIHCSRDRLIRYQSGRNYLRDNGSLLLCVSVPRCCESCPRGAGGGLPRRAWKATPPEFRARFPAKSTWRPASAHSRRCARGCCAPSRDHSIAPRALRAPCWRRSSCRFRRCPARRPATLLRARRRCQQLRRNPDNPPPPRCRCPDPELGSPNRGDSLSVVPSVRNRHDRRRSRRCARIFQDRSAAMPRRERCTCSGSG